MDRLPNELATLIAYIPNLNLRSVDSLIRSLKSRLHHSPSLTVSKVFVSVVITPGFRRCTNNGFNLLLRSIRLSVAGDLSENAFEVLLLIMEDLRTLLKKYRLRRHKHCTADLVSTLANIASRFCGNLRYFERFWEVTKLILVDALLSDRHGPKSDTAVEILKALMPFFLLDHSTPKDLVLIFVVNTMGNLKDESGDIRFALEKFTNHLIREVLSKPWARTAMIDSIVELVKGLKFQDGFADIVVRMGEWDEGRRLLQVDLIVALMMSSSASMSNTSIQITIENAWGLTCFNALLERCSDVADAIRAHAFTNLAQLLRLLCGSHLKNALQTLHKSCSDPIVSVKKAGILALSEAFRKFPKEAVVKEWLSSICYLSKIKYVIIREECQNLFLELVLDRISGYGSGSSENRAFVECILNEMCDPDFDEGVRSICRALSKREKLKPDIVVSLQDIIRLSKSLWLTNSRPIEKWTAPRGAWFLLSKVSAYFPRDTDWVFIYHHIQHLKQSLMLQDHTHISMITTYVRDLTNQPASDLALNLLGRLDQFNMDTDQVDAHVTALKSLHIVNLVGWEEDLLSKAFGIVKARMSEESPSAEIALCTIGCLARLPGVSVSNHLSSDIPLLEEFIRAEKRDPLYVQVWVTMGALCLKNGKLAKRCIPLFVQELEKSDSADLRRNIVVVLADLYIQYHSLVDCHLSKITKCLRDPCERVRMQTFIVLSRLLQRDKFKPSQGRAGLLLQLLISLVDESEEEIHHDFLFGNILKDKAPIFTYDCFLDAMFLLNGCYAYLGCISPWNSPKERELFSTCGNDEKSRSSRMHIYLTLLKQMAPVHLVATFTRICGEIIAAASAGSLKFEDVAGQSVLQDAFHVLSSKEIQISSIHRSTLKSANKKDKFSTKLECLLEGRDIDITGAILECVRQLEGADGVAKEEDVMKSVIVCTSPIIEELKCLLESQKNPLAGSLEECYRNLIEDYK